jgi:hypothetical protein
LPTVPSVPPPTTTPTRTGEVRASAPVVLFSSLLDVEVACRAACGLCMSRHDKHDTHPTHDTCGLCRTAYGLCRIFVVAACLDCDAMCFGDTTSTQRADGAVCCDRCNQWYHQVRVCAPRRAAIGVWGSGSGPSRAVVSASNTCSLFFSLPTFHVFLLFLRWRCDRVSALSLLRPCPALFPPDTVLHILHTAERLPAVSVCIIQGCVDRGGVDFGVLDSWECEGCGGAKVVYPWHAPLTTPRTLHTHMPHGPHAHTHAHAHAPHTRHMPHATRLTPHTTQTTPATHSTHTTRHAHHTHTHHTPQRRVPNANAS